ncbi:MAG: ATP-binding protein [Phycisphaerales bacterium]
MADAHQQNATAGDGSPHAQSDLANARLAAIIQSSDDAIISKDLQGVVQSWNGGAERMFGYAADEMIGRPITILIPADRPNEEPSILARLRLGERVDHFETVRRAKDGRLLDVSVTISPIRDSHGKIMGASKVARDITDRKRIDGERESLLAAERTARGEAERHGRMKDEFLATLGHELRTPLNAVLGWATLLKSPKTQPADLTHGLTVIERNARLQTQLIEDLLDMSRIVSGKLRLNVQAVDLSAVIHAAMEAAGPAADVKEIRLTHVLDPLAGLVSGDPNRLQQVVWNLLSNAVKFTPKGGRIQIVLERINSHVDLSVIDSGEGINPEFLPLVFDRFRQADASTTRRHGGLGLGLAIVKHVTELHGGSVRAQSPGPGRGSTFTVSLPVRATHTDGFAQSRSPSELSAIILPDDVSLAGLKAIVVDDEPDARDLVRRVLEEAGAHVMTASGCPDQRYRNARSGWFRPHQARAGSSAGQGGCRSGGGAHRLRPSR